MCEGVCARTCVCEREIIHTFMLYNYINLLIIIALNLKVSYFIHTPPTLFPPRGSRDISDTPPRHPHFTKTTSYKKYRRRYRWQAHTHLITVHLRCECCQSFSRLLRYPRTKGRDAILLFCPGHHTRLSII
jgi:hypothetical protein